MLFTRGVWVLFSSNVPPQPARLNVFKNDQDTWDYTNPNLSGQGTTHSPYPSLPLSLPLLFPLSCHYGMGGVPCLLGVLPLNSVEWLLQCSLWSFQCSEGTTPAMLPHCIFMHFLATQQAQCEGTRSDLKGSRLQLKLNACSSANLWMHHMT